MFKNTLLVTLFSSIYAMDGEYYDDAAALERAIQESLKTAQDEELARASQFAVLQNTASQEQLQQTANYIKSRPTALSYNLNNAFDTTFLFIEMPFCAVYEGINLIPDLFSFKETKNQAEQDLKTFCKNQNIEYNSVNHIFAGLWQGIFKELNPLCKIYNEVIKIQTDNKAIINNELLEIEKNGEDNFKKLIQDLGITKFYNDLKVQKETINTDLSRFQRMSAEEIIAYAATNKSEHPNDIKPSEKNHIAKQEIEQEILAFQQKLNQEFIEKQGRAGDETVMAYGSGIAKNYYQDLDNHINIMWGKINDVRRQLKLEEIVAQNVENFRQIIGLHNNVINDLGHEQQESNAIKRSLEVSFERHNSRYNPMYLQNDQTQYDYLLMVSSQVFRFKQIDKNKETVNILLASYFNALADQYDTRYKESRCQAGMIGRLFTVHKQTLDMLIEYYNDLDS